MADTAQATGGQDASIPPLPKVPVPPVAETLDRYLDAVKPMLDQAKFDKTKQKVSDFLSDVVLVQDVEAHLRQRREEEENWAFEYWLSDMYMANPVALPVNSNPGWVLRGGKDKAEEDTRTRLSFLARMAVGMLDCKKKFESGGLPQDFVTSRGGLKEPLCMEQYYKVFNTYRFPGEEGDRQEVTDGREGRGEEVVVVIRRSRLFSVVVKKDSEWIGEEEMLAVLENIQDLDLPLLPLEERVPMLTGVARDRWASHREILEKDSIASSATLRALERCLFILCLDERSQNWTDEDRSQSSRFLQMICGEGPLKNGANRWYDKTIQLVSCPDGTLGICYEHSVAEGIAVVGMVTEVFKEVEKMRDKVGESKEDWSWRLTPHSFGDLQERPEVRRRVAEAAEEFGTLCSDTDLEVFRFSPFGKDFMKSSRCSPDGFVQMALQLAYYSLRTRLCFSYESASTRRFRLGRVDNIRSSHPEAEEWCKAMKDESSDNESRLALFRKAMAKQSTLIKENITGRGLDIPLLGIREACRALGKQNQIFDDVYATSNQFKLSTSQVPINLPYSYMGYGAVVPDGYGVSYNLQGDHIIFCVSSFFSSGETSSLEMCTSIEQSLNDMKKMLTAAKEE